MRGRRVSIDLHLGDLSLDWGMPKAPFSKKDGPGTSPWFKFHRDETSTAPRREFLGAAGDGDTSFPL